MRGKLVFFHCDNTELCTPDHTSLCSIAPYYTHYCHGFLLTWFCCELVSRTVKEFKQSTLCCSGILNI